MRDVTGAGWLRDAAVARRIAAALVVLGLVACSQAGVAGASRAHRSPEGAQFRLRVRAITAAHAPRPYYRVRLSYPEVLGPAPDRGIARLNSAMAAAARQAEKSFEKFVASTSAVASGVHNPSTLQSSASSDVLGGGLGAFTLDVTQFPSGAAHPTSALETFNFDLVNGRRITLASLFRPKSPWLQVLSKESRKLLPSVLGPEGIERFLFHPGTAPLASNFSAFALTPWGLLLQFQEYQVAPYASGQPAVLVPFAALARVSSAAGPLGSLAALARPTAPNLWRFPLLPALVPPVRAECDLPVSHVESIGPVTPLMCRRGGLNARAWAVLAEGASPVLSLGPHPRRARVLREMCAVLRFYGGATVRQAGSYVRSAERVAGLYYGWHLGKAALTAFPAHC